MKRMKGRRSDMMNRFWLTPSDLYAKLNDEFSFDFDPCPYPCPNGYDGTLVPWGSSNFVNPPFRRSDGLHGKGPTAFVRKAIDEYRHGRGSVLILPTQSYVNLLLESGAEVRSLGRVKWIEARTGRSYPNPSSITAFVLKGSSCSDS